MRIISTTFNIVGNDLVAWAHEAFPKIPTISTAKDTATVLSRLPFCSMHNKHVYARGPMRRVLVFRYGLQLVYSRTKGGVDAAAQLRSGLNKGGAVVNWEQNVKFYLLIPFW